MASAALVGTDGSVDWCCFPRFDSPSVFAAILDQDDGGRFRIRPTSYTVATRQEYVPDTNILETTFATSSGIVSLTDFMPISEDHDDNPMTPPDSVHEIHRVVTCRSGEVDLRCDFQPRHDYARVVPEFSPLRAGSGGGALRVHGGRQTMTLAASIPFDCNGQDVSCDFKLTQGQTATFVLAYGTGRPSGVQRYRTSERMEETRRYWLDLVEKMNYQGLWRDSVVRSFLVLHLMMYRRSGAVVAAPTTSLPETIGGSRN